MNCRPFSDNGSGLTGSNPAQPVLWTMAYACTHKSVLCDAAAKKAQQV